MDLPAVDCKFPGICKSLLVSGGKSWSAVRNIPKITQTRSAACLADFWPVLGPIGGSGSGSCSGSGSG